MVRRLVAALAGYLAAVATGSLCLWALLLAATAAGGDFLRPAAHDVRGALGMLAVIAAVSAGLFAIPAAVGRAALLLAGREGPGWFAAVGAASACAVALYAFQGDGDGWRLATIGAVPGALGGLVFRWVERRVRGLR